MLRVIQFLCGIAVFAAIVFSWLWALPLANRIAIQRDRPKYKPEVFLVLGAAYHREAEFGPTWWLTGTVAGKEERLVPELGGTTPHSADDLLARHPKGSTIDVFYNPDATEMLVQGESLRVLEATPNFWREEAALFRWLALRVLLPVPVALLLYLAVRYANRGRERLRQRES